MPMSQEFQDRLFPVLPKIIDEFGTPFHIYDEKGIRETIENMQSCFKGVGYKQFYAVKAAPTPALLQIMFQMGCGFDCSSIPELVLVRKLGAKPEDIMFTSNNTSHDEFEYALSEGGCILNLDDISLIDKVPEMPELVCFRYNPGNRRTGNAIIGEPEKAKYGVTHDQVVDAYRLARDRGAKRFGLHTMICSNELNHEYMTQTVSMLLEIVLMLKVVLDIEVEFINIGGGVGIPYRPEQEKFDLHSLGSFVSEDLPAFRNVYGWMPRLFTECGRYVTGPHGVLVSRVINVTHKYQTYYGVDTGMAALMRPGMYGAYHHVDILHSDGRPREGRLKLASVVGAICENCDRLTAEPRELPCAKEGDIVVTHDTGAHGRAMGFNYNGRLRPKELLDRTDSTVDLIRREETIDDLLATLQFEPRLLNL